MNRLDSYYKDLLNTIIDHGVEKQDRTGTGTKAIFGWQVRHKMGEGFPVLTTKKIAWKSVVTELMWFLRGDTNIKYLVDNNCHIWDGDAYKAYVKYWEPNIEYIDGKAILTQEEFIDKIKTDDEFAKKWGDLGPIYGKQWRNWETRTTRFEKIINPGVYSKSLDQIQNLIDDLKANPDSRRLMVSAWNVGELDQMVLPPCHYGFQVFVRPLSYEMRLSFYRHTKQAEVEATENELDQMGIPKRALSLMWNQRSVDTFLGLPFNIASYGLLLSIICYEVKMLPDLLIGNFGDTHLYLNHFEQAKEQIFRDPYDLPKLKFSEEFLEIMNQDITFAEKINKMTPNMFMLDGYQSHPAIKAPLSN